LIACPKGELTLTAYDQFQAAARAYAADPNPTTLLHLNRRALPLLDTAPQEPAWTPIDAPGALADDFYGVRVVCDRRLDADEVSRVSGCLGYALRCTLAGEDLSDPTVFYLSNAATTFTVLDFGYDATKSRRSDPDFQGAFDLAREMIVAGTPIRATNRAGWGTKGTRLVDGIGPVRLLFYVR